MRAGRVISMIFALQQHGRMTAGELAAQLEVSVRTVLRDVETLSGAGVPIYTVPGVGGGIDLLDGFRTTLTGFTEQESAALFLAGQPQLAAVLGLAPAAQAARRKLLLALPPALAGAAAGADGWFLHDPLGRDAVPDDQETLRLIARAIHARVEVRPAGNGSSASEALRPLALVLEAGHWYVVHLGADGPQLRSLSDLTSTAPTTTETLTLGRGFSRPEDFDLTEFWKSLRAATMMGVTAGGPRRSAL